jgi:hypothetical protein
MSSTRNATIVYSVLATFIVVLALCLTGCGGSLASVAPTAPSAVVPVASLHSIVISPKVLTLAVGATQTYSASGFDANGKAFPVPSFKWASDNVDVASVSSAVVSAIGEGTANITASASGVTSLNSVLTVDSNAPPVPPPAPPTPTVLTFSLSISGSISSNYTVALATPMGCYGAPLPSGVMYAGYYTTINFAGDVCFDASAFTNVSGAQPSLTYVGQGPNPNVANFAIIVANAQQGAMLISAQLSSTDSVNYTGTWSTLWASSESLNNTGSATAQIVAGAW